MCIRDRQLQSDGSQEIDFFDELEAPNSRSEEDAELIYMDLLYPEQALRIGANLLADKKIQFKDFLSNNLDVFTWTPIDLFIIYHQLSIDAGVKPIK